MKADSFLVMAHGTADEMVRSKPILDTANPSHLLLHANVRAVRPTGPFTRRSPRSLPASCRKTSTSSSKHIRRAATP